MRLDSILVLIHNSSLDIELMTREGGSIVIADRETIVRGYNSLLEYRVIGINAQSFSGKNLLVLTLDK